MISLGIIGTNWITRQFIDAAIETKQYKLSAVYSRNLTKAQTFAKDFPKAECYTSLTTFFENAKLDVVYIASPNSLHFKQAKQAILAGKHVIVEKPAFSTPKEMNEIIELANQQHVFFFEAARNIHEASFKTVGDALPLSDQILGANFSYMKYSSRYDQVLAGEEPNIFSKKFSGGALMDLGVYLIYAALGWFGQPRESHYFAQMLDTGVDGMGVGILRYENFDVTIQPGKIGDAYLPNEIYTTSGTLVLNGVNAIEHAVFHDRIQQTEVLLPVHAQNNPMVEEAKDFANVINHPQDADFGVLYQEWVELARNVNQVLYDLRMSAHITFDADQ